MPRSTSSETPVTGAAAGEVAPRVSAGIGASANANPGMGASASASGGHAEFGFER
ncbi:MAG TPA: hypothetical protein VII53_00580 [Solirubrobacteraceae bacterium]